MSVPAVNVSAPAQRALLFPCATCSLLRTRERSVQSLLSQVLADMSVTEPFSSLFPEDRTVGCFKNFAGHNNLLLRFSESSET